MASRILTGIGKLGNFGNFGRKITQNCRLSDFPAQFEFRKPLFYLKF